MTFKDPLKELRESMKAMQMAFKDPLKELRDSMKAMQMAYNDPLKELRESMKVTQMAFNNPLKELHESMKAMQMAFKDPLKELRESMKAMQMDLQDPFRELRESLNIYNDIFKRSIPANSFEQAYKEVYAKFIIEQSDSDIEEAFSQTVNQIKSGIASSKSPLSIEFYLNFLIALILFLYSMHLSQGSEKKILDEITLTQEVIVQNIQDAVAMRSDAT